MLTLAVAAAFIAAVPPSFAQTSVESLRRHGAGLQSVLEGLDFARAAEETERERDVKLTRLARDKAYRAGSELAMIERTSAEVQRELDALARDPQDQARQDR